MTWKKVNNADPGDATHHGGDSTDKISDLFSGVDVDDVDVASDWVFRDDKLKLRNPANTFSYTISTSAIGADRTLTVPLLTASSTLAVLELAQTFTEPITIAKNDFRILKIYRTSNAVNDVFGIDFDANDSGSAQQTYGSVRGEILTNTAGAENGRLIFRTTQAGVETTCGEFTTTGGLKIGNNRRIVLTETGLTGERTYTFPNLSDKLVGETGTAILTNKTINAGYNYGQTDANIIRGTGVDNPYAGSPTGPTLRRTGLFPAVGSAEASGYVGGTFTSIGTTSSFRSTTEGFGQDYDTTAVANANAGLRQGTARFRREWGCYVIGRFKINSTSDVRLFIGFSSDTAEIAGETTLNNFSGVGIGKAAADTNYFTYRNDGDATQDKVDTTIVADTSFHTFEMQLDATNFQCKIDGTAQTTQTTEIPAVATDLAFHCEIETGAGAAAKILTLLPIFFRTGN